MTRWTKERGAAQYDAAPKANPVDPAIRRQSEELLAALKAGKAPPPLAKIDAPAALEAARRRYRAREALAKLPLSQKAAPLLDQVLGPARSTSGRCGPVGIHHRFEALLSTAIGHANHIDVGYQTEAVRCGRADSDYRCQSIRCRVVRPQQALPRPPAPRLVLYCLRASVAGKGASA